MRTQVNAVAVFVFFAGNLWAQAVPGEKLPLYYDVATGNVTVDTTNISGGEFVGYFFAHPSASRFDFLPENHTPFMPTLLGPTSTHRSIQELSWPNDPLEPGVYSIGNILPAGLSRDELMAEFFAGTGRPTNPFEPSFYRYYARGSYDLDPTQYHVFEINYAASPFPPLNDPNPGPPEEIKWATEASLSYDPGDGTLFLDTTGPNGGIAYGYHIELRDDDVLRVDEFTPATSEMFISVRSNLISESSRIEEGIHNLGNILPTGLDEQGLRDVIESAEFIGEPGHGVGGLDVSLNGRPFALALASTLPSFGDANLDGIVDAKDLNILGTNWLRDDAAGWPDGDFNGDRNVDQLDLSVLGENWHVAAAAVIPEPSTSWLALISLVFLARSCRSPRWLPATIDNLL